MAPIATDGLPCGGNEEVSARHGGLTIACALFLTLPWRGRHKRPSAAVSRVRRCFASAVATERSGGVG